MSFSARVIGFAMVAILGTLAISFLQKKFDDSDVRKAVKAIQAKFPESKDCVGSVQSRLRGTVLVQCGEHHWTVDVTRGLIL